jgi:hypothetical protein
MYEERLDFARYNVLKLTDLSYSWMDGLIWELKERMKILFWEKNYQG